MTSRPRCSLDLDDPGFVADPYPEFARQRGEGPESAVRMVANRTATGSLIGCSCFRLISGSV
jgi:hypothetical protein